MSETTSTTIQTEVQASGCPLCHYTMVAPVFICERKHRICKMCAGITSICPACGKKIREYRSANLEKHPEQALYPCRYHDAGCKKKFLLKDLAAHQVSCPLRTYYCEPCRPRCRWRGKRFQILEHMKDEHKELVWIKAFNSLVYENFDVESDYSCVHVLSIFRELFWYHSRRDTEAGRLYEVVQLVGKPSSNAACYTYEIQFYKRENSYFRSALFRSRVHGEEEDAEGLFKSGDCIVLDLAALRHFVDDKKRLFFDFRVEKAHCITHQKNGIYGF